MVMMIMCITKMKNRTMRAAVAFIIDHLKASNSCFNHENCTQGRTEQGDEAKEADPRDLRSVQVGSEHSGSQFLCKVVHFCPTHSDISIVELQTERKQGSRCISGCCRCRDASKTPIFWDTDITALEGDEIRVEVTS